MKYKHHTLLPIHAFQGRGSVVGGRSLRLHGGDGGGGEGGFGGSDYDPAYEDEFQRKHAEFMASKGYPRLLEDYNATKAAEEAAMRAAAAKAEQDAINARNAYAAEQYRLEAARMQQEANRLAEQQRQQAAALQAQQAAAAAAEQQRQAAAAAEQQRIAQVVASYKPFDPNKYGIGGEESNAYYTAALNANRLMAEGRPDVAQRLIDEANQYVSQFEEKAKKEQELQQTYGSRPYGTGMGPALGYAYGMKNAEGDLFRKFDAQGNLTEFMDQHGQWQPASIFKPVGYEYNDETGQYVTQYQVPNSSVVRSGGFEPNRYRDQQGGWLGEGGWGNIAALVATALTANPAWMVSMGVPAAMGSAVIQGAATVAKGINNGQSFGEALSTAVKNGVINAATAGVMNALGESGLEAIAEVGSQGDAGMSMSPTQIQGILKNNTDAGSIISGALGDAGASMSFADLVNSTGLGTSIAEAVGGAANTISSGSSLINNTGTKRDTTATPVVPPAVFAPVAPPPTSTYVPPTYTPTPVAPAQVLPERPGSFTPDIINTINEQATKNQESGMTREQALNAAITGVSGMLGMTERNLLDSIQGTKTELGSEIQGARTQLAGVESNLLNQIYQYEMAGLTRDQALQKAITGVSTQLGLTEQNLLNELGVTKTDLSNKITDVETNLGGQIAGVGTQVTDLTKDFTDFSDWSKEQEENRRRKQEGEEAVGLLSQMASGSVKSGIPARIDYMYDIGGESLFATPKQESLMPSPYEEQPEPVEGAMPKYQYYDPAGGYLYAGGGMVDDYTDEDLYRILGSRS